MTSADKDRLQKVVREVAARITRYHGTNFNEQDTKATLIEPVLEALGWQLRDPEHVRREFRTNSKDNPVDYALLLMRQARLMVEAKALGESMDDARWMNQTIAYAAIGGAMWCVLTNGDEYQIYHATAPVAARDKLLCKVRLSENTPDDVVRVLSLISYANMGENIIDVLWKTQHIDRRVKGVLEKMFAEPDKRLGAAIRQRDDGLAPKDIMASLRRLAVRIDPPPIQIPAAGLPKRHAPHAASEPAHPKPKKKPEAESRRRRARGGPRVELSQVITAGLLSPGVKLFRTYRKRLLEAVLQADGQVEFDGTTY